MDENITGCIYMYTNKLNNKKYIGQTICKLNKRHHEHLYRDDSYIDRALRKYGEENFILEVIEDNIPKKMLNDKERYYIEKYDTYNNGYNLTLGGGGSPRIDADTINKVIDAIRSTNLTLGEIGKQFGFSVYTMTDINTGKVYYAPDIEYPVRKEPCTQIYSQEILDITIDLLINTTLSFDEISNKIGVNYYYVSDVNRGRVNGDYHGYTTPLRRTITKTPMTKEMAQQIIDILKTEDISADAIGNKLGIPSYTVGQINRGKAAICKEFNESFPIRKAPHRNKLTAQELCAKLSIQNVEEIIELLLNTSLSTAEIANRYNVDKNTIDRINRRDTWKNILPQYKAPIRTNPRNKQQS